MLRDLLEKPIRMDFLSIFEACAQERTCEKPIKTIVIFQVFRKSSHLRANRPAGAKDLRKITKIDPPGVPKSIQDRQEIALDLQVGVLKRSKSNQDRPGRSEDPPESSESLPRAPRERPKSAQERPKSAPRAPQEGPQSTLC